MSRPETPIDWKKVDDLLEAGCLGTEIAACFNIHPTTFYRRVEEKYSVSFTEYSFEKKSKGNSIIRKAQFDKATNKKDNAMLIWLGKNRLGQKESHDSNLSPEFLTQFNSLMKSFQDMQNQSKDLNNAETKESEEIQS